MSKNDKPLTKVIADKIIQIIKDNNMEEGDRLKNEYDLARDLNVGRGTVREAIKILVARNILQVRQGAGTFISSKNSIPEDPLGLIFIENDESLMLDVLDVRLIIEPEIASMAALNANEKQLEEIRKQCDVVEKLIMEDKDYQEADVIFHQKIAECSGNKVVDRLIPVINSSVALNIVGTKDQYKNFTIHEHRAIAEAIERGDHNGAKFAMITHLNTSRKEVMARRVEK